MPNVSNCNRCIKHVSALVLLFSSLGMASAEPISWKNFQWMPPSTETSHLVSVQFGSELSRQVSQVRSQGYESAGGNWISMDPWYRSTWKDLRLTWMTQLTRNSGFLWGLGTGERGEKYAIAPSLKFGFVHQASVGTNALLSLRATTVLGGRMSEKSCVADYGEIGGVQEVNCRMAASTMPPAETLKYLMNGPPRDRFEVMVQFKQMF